MALPRRLRAYLASQSATRQKRDAHRVKKRRRLDPNRIDRRRRCRDCGRLSNVMKLNSRDQSSKSLTCGQQKGQTQPAPSPLLALPAELRNRIYEYTLASEIPTHIMARNINRMPPPWLLSCKQIYNEALKIWFYVNQKHTVIEIDDLDARTFIHWTKRRQELKVPFNDPPVHCRTSYNWKNLMLWCKAVWAAKTYWEMSPSNGGVWASETNLVVWSALELASDYHDLPWQDCEQALGSLRNAISVYQPRWGGSWA